jgi:membrane-bound lytic murein transglycosylase D
MKPSNLCRVVVCLLTLLLASCGTLQQKNTDAMPPIASAESTHTPVITPEATPVATSAFATIWDRMRAGYGLPEASNAQIDSQIRFYTTNRAYFAKVFAQSEPYLYYVTHELEAAKIPLEFALLPFIESGYNPSANAPGNAGLWQLGVATGKNYGTKQVPGYDGRKDVVASTQATIKLLKALYTNLNQDWFLVIAAYNAGEGTVTQAIAKNSRSGKPTDFWSLPLTARVQGYVPQLLALSKIVAKPDKYNYTLPPIADAPYFAQIQLSKPINLMDSIKNTQIDAAIFKRLNAGYSTPVTNPVAPGLILVPITQVNVLKQQLSNLGDIPSPTFVATQEAPSAKKSANNDATSLHTVKSGESFWQIAKDQKTTVAALLKLNNLSASTQLKPGQKIRVR